MTRLAALMLTMAALPAAAHDLWLEREGASLVLMQGHRHSAHAGAETLPYEPGFVKTSLCLDVRGAVKALAPSKTAPWKTAADCAALLVTVSSGYWTKTPWETKNLPKDQVQGSIKSWLSEEAVKRIERWSPGADRPMGTGIEITPAFDPLALKAGDKLVVLVTDNRLPRAGVAVAYGGDVRGTTGEDGRIGIRLRHGGVQLIEASAETPLADGKADSQIRTATLQFDLPR